MPLHESQRIMLHIQKYDVQITYVPGKDIPLADTLSWLNPCPGDCIEGLDVSIHEISMHLNTSPTRIQQIQSETAKDPVLTSLMTFITHRWPDKRSVSITPTCILELSRRAYCCKWCYLERHAYCYTKVTSARSSESTSLFQGAEKF